MDKKACKGYCQTSSDIHPNVMTHSGGTKPYPLTVYFDGECPICRREIDFMKIFNRRNHLQFIDFSASSFLSPEHGLSPCDLGKVIHARWSDGTIITGVEVFREMWEAIGLRALARLARRPTVNKLLVRAYAWFAKNRLRLTGRA
jgi:predicted DCC family thiol-disulfide oxidoreductase YuxK